MATPPPPEDWRLATLTALVSRYGPKNGCKYEKAIHAAAPDPLAAYNALGRFVAAEEQRRSPTELLAETSTIAADWDSCVYADVRGAANGASETERLEVKEGAIQCRRCGGRKTYYYQMQTRSADEGMTTFYSCTVCGARWRG